jgi:hypothetical protein
MQFSRFMTASTFLTELGKLRAFRGQYMGAGLLESLEVAGLLHPRLRIRYPDPIVRRFWQSSSPEMPRVMKQPVEPDGARWDDARKFDRAVDRNQNWIVYGLAPHPLDDPEPRFAQFIQRPALEAFVPQRDRRVDISNNVEDTLFTDNYDDRYSTWQLLLAAEQADAGVHLRIMMDGEQRFCDVHEALDDGRLPAEAGYRINFLPMHAARDFKKHEKTLDAVVWFAEERSRALNNILKGQGGRFRLSAEQNAQYEEDSQRLGVAACDRFDVATENLVALIRYFAERWSEWTHEGRPLIAGAYKEFVGVTVRLARRCGGLSFGQLRDRVGAVGGWFKPVLDLMWPDWAQEEKERVRLTLQASLARRTTSITEADITAFVAFLASEGLEAFFWRLNSFENHALRGNEYAIEGMKSDIQGMAVVIEHAAMALGATETQLFEKYKQLWRDPHVLTLLRRGDVAQLARQSRLIEDWPTLKADINALRSEPGGEIAADLVMAHRIRGGVHVHLPEDDHFELEALFTGLMRASLLTFIEARPP